MHVEGTHACAHACTHAKFIPVKQDVGESDTLNLNFLRSPTSVKNILSILQLKLFTAPKNAPI